MSDPIVSVPQSWVAAIAGGAWAAIIGVFAYFRQRIERVEDRANSSITRDELGVIETRIEARALAAENRVVKMHEENSNNFREMRLQLESVNTKLFELASKK